MGGIMHKSWIRGGYSGFACALGLTIAMIAAPALAVESLPEASDIYADESIVEVEIDDAAWVETETTEDLAASNGDTFPSDFETSTEVSNGATAEDGDVNDSDPTDVKPQVEVDDEGTTTEGLEEIGPSESHEIESSGLAADEIIEDAHDTEIQDFPASVEGQCQVELAANNAKNGWVKSSDGTLEYYVNGVLTTPHLVFYEDEASGNRYWYENGRPVEEHAFWDPVTDRWYWADAGGVLARNKDTYIPVNNEAESGDWRNNGYGKWVRVSDDYSMVKGEDYRVSKDDGQWHWWYFDTTTAQMRKGFCWVDSSGGKWVYYDQTFGWMVYGAQMIDDRPYYFDECTGARLSEDQLTQKLIGVINTTYGQDIDCNGELASAGGRICSWGPCMAYVWWCFRHAGLGDFLSGGETSGWPHDNYYWYQSRGRLDYSPRIGDIAFFHYPGWTDDMGVPAGHAAIVVAINGNSVLLAEASEPGIVARWYNIREWCIVGYGHPYWS